MPRNEASHHIRASTFGRRGTKCRARITVAPPLGRRTIGTPASRQAATSTSSSTRLDDPITTTGRAAGIQIAVVLQVTLTERATGKVLYSRPSCEIRQRYEVSTEQQAYFDESGPALERLSREVARQGEEWI